jgi:hypothetical protein
LLQSLCGLDSSPRATRGCPARRRQRAVAPRGGVNARIAEEALDDIQVVPQDRADQRGGKARMPRPGARIDARVREERVNDALMPARRRVAERALAPRAGIDARVGEEARHCSERAVLRRAPDCDVVFRGGLEARVVHERGDDGVVVPAERGGERGVARVREGCARVAQNAAHEGQRAARRGGLKHLAAVCCAELGARVVEEAREDVEAPRAAGGGEHLVEGGGVPRRARDEALDDRHIEAPLASNVDGIVVAVRCEGEALRREEVRHRGRVVAPQRAEEWLQQSLAGLLPKVRWGAIRIDAHIREERVENLEAVRTRVRAFARVAGDHRVEDARGAPGRDRKGLGEEARDERRAVPLNRRVQRRVPVRAGIHARVGEERIDDGSVALLARDDERRAARGCGVDAAAREEARGARRVAHADARREELGVSDGGDELQLRAP